MASDKVLEERDGVAGEVRFVWAIWSPVDDCWAYIASWSRADGWKARAMSERLSQFWPFPMAVVEVFEPVGDVNDDAIAKALSELPPSRLRLSASNVAAYKAEHESAVMNGTY